MSQLILELLDDRRLDVLQKIRAFRSIGVLGGGTALSLQIGHRISYDFDIFTRDKLPRNLWRDVKKILGSNCKKLLDYEDQLNLITPSGINVTFFYDDYKFISQPIKTPYIDLMSLRDIAANKAYIIGKRPKWRDYVDLYFLLNRKYVTFEALINLSEKKFRSDFTKRLFLQQLVYWEDVMDYKIEFLNKSISPKKIKSFLEKVVKEFRENKL